MTSITCSLIELDMPPGGLLRPDSVLLDKPFQRFPLGQGQSVKLDPADPVTPAVRCVVDLKVRNNLTVDVIDNYHVVGIGYRNVVKRAGPFVWSGIACSQPFGADVDEGCRMKDLRFTDKAKPGRLFEDNV